MDLEPFLGVRLAPWGLPSLNSPQGPFLHPPTTVAILKPDVAALKCFLYEDVVVFAGEVVRGAGR